MRRVRSAIACACVALVVLSGCGNRLAVLKRAARLAERREYAKAIEAYEHSIELAGASEATTYERAEAYYQIGVLRTYSLHEPERGREAFEQAVALEPDYAEPQFHLAVLYIEGKPQQVDAAEAALDRALEARPEITSYELPGRTLRPRAMLANIKRQRGQLNEAIRQLYINEHYSSEDAQDWLELGRFFAEQQEHAKALFYTKRAFDTLSEPQRATPRGMAVRLSLIGALLRNGYLDEAGEMLNESFAILAQHEAYFARLSSQEQRDNPGFKTYLISARRELLGNRVTICLGLGQYQDALNTVTRLRDLEPGTIDLLLQEAWLEAEIGDIPTARERLDMYRRLRPSDANAVMTEARILAAQGNWRDYLERIQAYESVVPESARARAMVGYALVKAGRIQEGLRALERQCRDQPNFPNLQLMMAQALSAVGRSSEAIWWLRRVAETDIVPPDTFEVEDDWAAVRQDPAFPELLRALRYRISLRQQVHEAEDMLYRGETTRALGTLERLRGQNADIIFTTYALARGYVFIGDHDAAFPLLIECAKAGYFNPANLQRDIYLTELHDDARFAELVDAIEQPWPTPETE